MFSDAFLLDAFSLVTPNELRTAAGQSGDRLVLIKRFLGVKPLSVHELVRALERDHLLRPEDAEFIAPAHLRDMVSKISLHTLKQCCAAHLERANPRWTPMFKSIQSSIELAMGVEPSKFLAAVAIVAHRARVDEARRRRGDYRKRVRAAAHS
jgi:hypothetical protein